MKKLKVISAVLCLTVLLSVLPVFTGSVAAATPTVELVSSVGRPGEIVAITLKVSNSENVLAVAVGNLQWDTTTLTFERAEWSDIEDSNGGLVIKDWDYNFDQGVLSFTNKTNINTELLTFYFKSKDAEREYTTYLSCDVRISVNGDSNWTTYSVSDNEVLIQPYPKGDANCDGVLDDADPLYLLYHIHFGEALYPLGRPCDVDRNGSLNTKDVTYLLYAVMYPDRYPLGSDGSSDDFFGDLSPENPDYGFDDWQPLPLG